MDKSLVIFVIEIKQYGHTLYKKTKEEKRLFKQCCFNVLIVLPLT